VSDRDWPGRHWRTIAQSYSRTPCFGQQRATFEHLYLECAPKVERLSEVNRLFIDAVCRTIGIRTRLTCSTQYRVPDGVTRTGRLVALCRAAGARRYLSGPRARAYIDEAEFTAAGIELEYMDYDGYPEYAQPYPPFEHQVSVLDLLFCAGDEAPRYMKSFR
jgi:hypothetical protein